METKKSNQGDLVALLDCCWFDQLILTGRGSPHPAAVSGGGGERCGEGAAEKRGMACLRERRTKSEDAYSKCNEEERRKKKRMGGRRRSKSMTELEKEEVKGFMDLGFVFSEEDKGTSLVSIIPGLLLLGENEGEQEEEEEEEEEGGGEEEEERRRRPYLSEAWKWRRRREEEVVRRWRMPASGRSEVEVKDSLRLWAHAVVASSAAAAAAVT